MGSPLHGDSGLSLALICRVQRRLCALPLAHVCKALRPLPVQPVAGAPAYVRGLSLIRGVTLPVVDAGRLLEGDQPQPPDSPKHDESGARFVTVRSGTRQVALAVDAVLGIRDLAAAAQQPLPPLLRESAGDAVASMTRLDADLLLVAHTNFKRPRTARRPGRDPPGRDICGSKIVAAVPIRTASPLPRRLVWP